MKKFLLIITIVSYIVADTICIPTKVTDLETSYKLSKDEILKVGYNKFYYNSDKNYIKVGKDIFKYSLTMKDIDVYKHNNESIYGKIDNFGKEMFTFLYKPKKDEKLFIVFTCLNKGNK